MYSIFGTYPSWSLYDTDDAEGSNLASGFLAAGNINGGDAHSIFPISTVNVSLSFQQLEWQRNIKLLHSGVNMV